MQIAKVFLALVKEGSMKRVSKNLVLKTASEYAPKTTDRDYVKKNDVPWIDRFAADGGKAIISGDVKMRERAHERLALYDHGFVVIFFERQYGDWNFFRKSSLILHWWEEITTKIQTADKGTFWVVPASWPVKQNDLRNVSIGLAQLLTDSPNKVAKPKAKKKRKKPRFIQSIEGQSELLQTLETLQNEKKTEI